jgi:hypothetical protein
MTRKFLATLAMSIFLIGGVFSPLTFSFSHIATPGVQYAHAQLIPPGVSAPVQGPATEDGTLPNPNDSLGSSGGNSGGSGSGGGNPQQAGNQTVEESLCAWTDFSCRLIMGFSGIISFTPTLLATVAGMVFDYSIWSSLQSGTYTAFDGETGDEGFVVKGWKLVRDFANLIFIFALFFIAFVLILGLDDNPNGSPMGLNPKKTIARVIIMALLVNFSFFFGRSVIEVTNIFALQFYNKITVAPQMSTATTQTSQQADVQSFYTNAAGVRSIATGVLNLINPQTFVLQNKEQGLTPTWSNFPTIWFFTILSAAFALFLVYIFLSIALLFIARTIGLFLFIIISPIAFVSYTVPFLQKQNYIGFDDWMKQFFGMAFMAPIFMFFLYISLQFFKVGIVGGTGFLSTAAQLVFKFAMVGFLLVFAKKLTQDLSGKVGSMVTGAITSVVTTGAMVGAAVATGGASAGLAVARQSATRGLASASNSVLGAERTEAIQQRLAGTNFRSIGQTFKDLPSKVTRGAQNAASNPLGALGSGVRSAGSMLGNTTMNLARASGSQYPDVLQKAMNQGSKLGSMDADKRKALLQRVNNIDQIRNVKNEKLEKIDKQISEIRKKSGEATDPNDKAKLNKQLADLIKERRTTANPPSADANKNKGGGAQANNTPAKPVTPGGTTGGAGGAQSLNVGTLKATNLVVGNTDGVTGKPGASTPATGSTPSPDAPKPDSKPESKNGYEQYQDDKQVLADKMGGIAEAFRPKTGSTAIDTSTPTTRATSLLGNIQSAAVNFKDQAPEQNSFDQSAIVADSLPGNNGDFDFGGIQLPSQDDQE